MATKLMCDFWSFVELLCSDDKDFTRTPEWKRVSGAIGSTRVNPSDWTCRTVTKTAITEDCRVKNRTENMPIVNLRQSPTPASFVSSGITPPDNSQGLQGFSLQILYGNLEIKLGGRNQNSTDWSGKRDLNPRPSPWQGEKAYL